MLVTKHVRHLIARRGNTTVPPGLECDMSTVAAHAPADSVSALLDRLHWTVTGHTRHRLATGKEERFPATQVRLHYLAEGAAAITGPSETLRIRAGDMVLAPRGAAHAVRAESPGDHPTVLISSAMAASEGGIDPVVLRLPEFLRACAFLIREPLAVALLDRIEAELEARRVGASSVVSQLANVLVTSAIRSWVEGGCDPAGWHRAALDPDIARAIAEIHRDPGATWTVERLARIAHVSRSTFAERFRSVVGDPPARYVARVRIERAKKLLRHQGLSVTQAALALGYGSDAAFSRAFTRMVGEPPSAWRR
jgi:AraC-like DNA-binding protein/mannose-6-phosphate isomerase-like protein (cupin superfamily)